MGRGGHGFHLGELGIWTKHVNYELANRIPLIFAGSGITNTGVATGQLTETLDIYPTLAALAGLPAPTGPQPIDGLSLVPVLQDPAKRIRDHTYHCFQRKRLGRAIRTETHRLVVWQRPNEPESKATFELYDYSDGPVEKINIADKNPDIVKELHAILKRYPKPFSGPQEKPKR